MFTCSLPNKLKTLSWNWILQWHRQTAALFWVCITSLGGFYRNLRNAPRFLAKSWRKTSPKMLTNLKKKSVLRLFRWERHSQTHLCYLCWKAKVSIAHNINISENETEYVLLYIETGVNSRPFGDWSHTLNDEEHKLAIRYREFLKLLYAIILLNLDLEGTYFTIQRGHRTLGWILTMAKATSKPVLWQQSS